MKIERTKNASRNIIWGTISKIISLLLPFVSRTVIIYKLGIDYVGLGSLFNSILQVLSLAELGIGGALVFSMYKPIAEDDDKTICALLNLYRNCYRIIGLIILVIGIIILPFLPFLIKGDVPADINLYVLYGIYLFNNVIGYFMAAYKQSIFTATQRVDIISKITLLLSIISNISQIILLIMFSNYYVYVIVIPVITCTNNLVLAHLAKKYFPQYKCVGKIGNTELAVIKKKIGGAVFQKIGNIILTSVDTIVISAFLGLKILGIYNGYYYVITALLGFLSVITQAIIPSIGNSIVENDSEKVYFDFKKFHFIYIWIVSWWSCALICLYQPFIRLWQGEENMLPFGIAVCLGIYFFTYKLGDICWAYREAIGLWWEGKFGPLISSIVNLTLNIILVRKIGIYGIVISTIISIVLITMPYGGYILYKHYFKTQKFRSYILRNIFYFLIMCVVSTLTYFICSLLSFEGVIELAVKTIICMLVPNVLLLLIYFKYSVFNPAAVFVVRLLPQKVVPNFIRKRIIKD